MTRAYERRDTAAGHRILMVLDLLINSSNRIRVVLAMLIQWIVDISRILRAHRSPSASRFGRSALIEATPNILERLGSRACWRMGSTSRTTRRNRGLIVMIRALDSGYELAITTARPQVMKVHTVIGSSRKARTCWIRMDVVAAQWKHRHAACGEAIASVHAEQKDRLVDALPVLHPLPRGRRS